MITLESIFSKKNIARAFEHLSVKKNGGNSDQAPLDELNEYWKLNRERILDEVRNLCFVPNLVQEYEIVNGKGKRRKVTRYTDSDRLITRLMAQKLNDFSHHYLKKRVTRIRIIRELQQLLRVQKGTLRIRKNLLSK